MTAEILEAGVGRFVELGVHRKAKVGEAETGVGFGGDGEFVFPLFPALSIFGKGPANHANGCLTIRSELRDPNFLQEGKVSLFLAGDNLGDEKGSAGGDGFLGECTTRFANDEVLLGEDGGHFRGPAEKLDFLQQGSESLFDATCDIWIPSGPNGDRPVILGGECFGQLGPALETRAEEIENTGFFAGGFVTGVRGGRGKARIDGETDGIYFFHRNAQGVEGLGGGGVGDNPKIGWGGGPEPMNGDRIGHDGDELEGGAEIAGKKSDVVGVDGKGEGDDFGAMGFDQVTEAKEGRTIGKKCLLDNGQVVTSKVEKIPGVRIAVDQGEIEAAKEVVHFGPRFGEGIGHDGGASP